MTVKIINRKGGFDQMSKILVLAGGVSTERDVSLITGKQIYNALKRNGHDVILTDVYLGYELPESLYLKSV